MRLGGYWSMVSVYPTFLCLEVILAQLGGCYSILDVVGKVCWTVPENVDCKRYP